MGMWELAIIVPIIGNWIKIYAPLLDPIYEPNLNIL
jgi:hypothetical protein